MVNVITHELCEILKTFRVLLLANIEESVQLQENVFEELSQRQPCVSGGIFSVMKVLLCLLANTQWYHQNNKKHSSAVSPDEALERTE